MKNEKTNLQLVNYLNSILKNKNLIQFNQPILISVSGGQDSICLLLLFIHLKNQWKFSIGLIFCNHLWQKESFYTSLILIKLSFLFKLPFYYSITTKKIFTEQKARNWRYSNFYRISFVYNYRFILTGHTASDRIETNFFQLIRGTSPKSFFYLNWKTQLLVQAENLLVITNKFCSSLTLFDCYNFINFNFHSPIFFLSKNKTNKNVYVSKSTILNKLNLKKKFFVVVLIKQLKKNSKTSMGFSLKKDKKKFFLSQITLIPKRKILFSSGCCFCEKSKARTCLRQKKFFFICIKGKKRYQKISFSIKRVNKIFAFNFLNSNKKIFFHYIEKSQIQFLYFQKIKKALCSLFRIGRKETFSSYGAESFLFATQTKKTRNDESENFAKVLIKVEKQKTEYLNSLNKKFEKAKLRKIVKKFLISYYWQNFKHHFFEANNFLKRNKKTIFLENQTLLLKMIPFKKHGFCLKFNSKSLHKKQCLIIFFDKKNFVKNLKQQVFLSLLNKKNIYKNLFFVSPEGKGYLRSTVGKEMPDSRFNGSAKERIHFSYTLQFYSLKEKVGKSASLNLKKNRVVSTLFLSQKPFFLVNTKLQKQFLCSSFTMLPVRRKVCKGRQEEEKRKIFIPLPTVDKKNFLILYLYFYFQYFPKTKSFSIGSTSKPIKKTSIIRPILFLNRFDSKRLLLFWNLPLYPDKSNQKMKYYRNRIRKQFLPAIRFFFNPQIDSILFQYIEINNAEQVFLNHITNKLFLKIQQPLFKNKKYYFKKSLFISAYQIKAENNFKKIKFLKTEGIFPVLRIPTDPKVDRIASLSTVDSNQFKNLNGSLICVEKTKYYRKLLSTSLSFFLFGFLTRNSKIIMKDKKIFSLDQQMQIDISVLKFLPISIQRRVIKKCLEGFFLKKTNFFHIEKIRKIIDKKETKPNVFESRTKATVQFPLLYKKNRQLVFLPKIKDQKNISNKMVMKKTLIFNTKKKLSVLSQISFKKIEILILPNFNAFFISSKKKLSLFCS